MRCIGVVWLKIMILFSYFIGGWRHQLDEFDVRRKKNPAGKIATVY